LFQFVETTIAKGNNDVYRRALEQFDRLVIPYVMRCANGQQNRAAEILGLSRVTLRAKLRHMQASVEKSLTNKAEHQTE
jgi:two-component system nitrogen regulation response regulator GlnG